MSKPAVQNAAWEATRAAARWRWVAIDGACVLMMLGLLALAFWPVYASWQVVWAVVGFGILGFAVAFLSALRGWGTLLTLGASAGAWFIFGTGLLMPSAGLYAVIPTPRSLLGLLSGPVTAWRDMLTLQPPIGETYNLLAVPGLIALMAGLLAGLISLRTTRPMLAFVPLVVANLAAAMLGASFASYPVLAGFGLFLVVLVWSAYRRAKLRATLSGATGRPKGLQLVMAAVVLAVAGGLVFSALPWLQPREDRARAREAVEPPVELEQFASPLQGFRANITKYSDTVLFHAPGLEQGEVLRLATLDKYDGFSFRVATNDDTAVEQTTFTRVGEWITTQRSGQDRSVQIEVAGYSDVWVPLLGEAIQVRFAGANRVALGENFFYNRASGTGLTPRGLEEGDQYRVVFSIPQRPSEQEIQAADAAEVTLPEDSGVPDRVRNAAHAWADGFPTDGAKALALEARLRSGYFSHGQDDEVISHPGHSQWRLTNLLAEPERMVGDGEQYATAMVLMARELGMPARVIYGYRGTGNGVVTGKDVGAWAEVNLAGLGWVQFDPTPPQDRTLDTENEPPPPTPRPHIENPPPPPQEPEPPPPDDELPINPAEPPEPEPQIDWGQIGRIAAVTGIPLLTIVVPLTLIVGLKWRRRVRRRNDPVIANRAAGAWAELVDRARDLGHSPSLSATRSEQAERFLEEFEFAGAHADPLAVSRDVDWTVFAPGDPSSTSAEEHWASTKLIERGLRRSVPRPRWLASLLSTKSFRRIR